MYRNNWIRLLNRLHPDNTVVTPASGVVLGRGPRLMGLGGSTQVLRVFHSGVPLDTTPARHSLSALT